MTTKGLTITGGVSLAPLHAVITTTDGAWASIATDGSIHIKWASGKISDIMPNEKAPMTAEESVSNICKVLAEMNPVVNMAPKNFMTFDEIESWFTSIGLEFAAI